MISQHRPGPLGAVGGGRRRRASAAVTAGRGLRRSLLGERGLGARLRRLRAAPQARWRSWATQRCVGGLRNARGASSRTPAADHRRPARRGHPARGATAQQISPPLRRLTEPVGQRYQLLMAAISAPGYAAVQAGGVTSVGFGRQVGYGVVGDSVGVAPRRGVRRR